jgi:predicted alpha/beta hydrolase family esterase
MRYTRYIIIHGTKGSPSGNWFPWLAAELGAKNAEVVIPEMPTPQGQSLESWFAAFYRQAGTIDSETCIIGHSLGAVFLLRYLERCLNPIGCAVFVAGFIGLLGKYEYDRLNASFIACPFDWGTIRINSGRILCIAGDNDPYVPLAQPTELADKLGANLQVVRGGGHLNSESGYESFPSLLEQL